MSGLNLSLELYEQRVVLQQLRDLEKSLKNKAVRSGLVEVAKPIKATAKQMAPKQSGALAKAVGHRSVNSRQKQRLGLAKDQVALIVGPNRKVNGRWQTKKGLWQEYGTENMTANPFLGPALDKHQGGNQQRFYQGLQRALEKLR